MSEYIFTCPRCGQETVNHPLYPGASKCCGAYSCCQERKNMTDQTQACGCKFSQIRDDVAGKMVYIQTVHCPQHPQQSPPPPPKNQEVKAQVAKARASLKNE